MSRISVRTTSSVVTSSGESTREGLNLAIAGARQPEMSVTVAVYEGGSKGFNASVGDASQRGRRQWPFFLVV